MLTVVVPTFNSLRFISSWVNHANSVINELGTKVRFRFYDNHSSDGSYEIVSKFVRKGIDSAKRMNCSVEEALHLGLEECETEFVIFWCVDDIIYPNFLRDGLKVLCEDPELGFAFAKSEMLILSTDTSQVSRVSRSTRYRTSGRYLIPTEEVFWLNYPNDYVLCRSAALRAAGGWVASFESALHKGKIVRPFAARLAHQRPCYFLDTLAYSSLKHPEQYSKRMAVNGAYAELFHFWALDLAGQQEMRRGQSQALRILGAANQDINVLSNLLSSKLKPRNSYFKLQDPVLYVDTLKHVYLALRGEYYYGESDIFEPIGSSTTLCVDDMSKFFLFLNNRGLIDERS